ncbi:MAG: hypothetical protein LUG95_02805 [Clostridiales bacterium]|nr:hypothetical protein [Clostridiales bacterium]
MTLQKSSANKQAARYDFKRAIVSLPFPFAVSVLVALYIFVYSPISFFSNYSYNYNYNGNIADTIETIREDMIIALIGDNFNVFIGIFAVIIGVLFAFLLLSVYDEEKPSELLFFKRC